MTVRVVIADDQALVRAGFRMILDAEDDLDVVGEAADGTEAVELARRLKPDVMLMDIRMPQLDGIEATRRVVALDGEAPVRVLMLTTFDLNEYVYEALRAGASGFLLKDVPPEQLAAGIRVVAQGEALLAPSITKRLIQEFAAAAPATPKPPRGLDELTARELEVFKLDRARALQRRDRRGADRQRDDRQDARRARADEARAARPRAGGRARLRVRDLRAGPAVRLKLVSWNVNSLKMRMPRVLELLEQHAPDVVLLQETKAEPDAFPAAELQAAGYHSAHHSAGRWAGVALLARTPLEEVITGLAGEPAVGRGALDRGDGGRSAARLGLRAQRPVDRPSGVREEARLPGRRARAHEHARRASRRLQRLPGRHRRLRPGRVRRLHACPAGGARALRGAARRRRGRRLPRAAPGEVGFTWWDYRQGHFHRKLGLRIDAFLVGPRVAGRIGECGIDRSFRKGPKPSDHAPLLLELA